MTAMGILRERIRERIEAIPGIRPEWNRRKPGEHVDKLYRFGIAPCIGFALDRKVREQVNLWVRADRVTATTVATIDSDRYDPDRNPGNPGRHSNLAAIPGFRDETLICFHPKTFTEAERIIEEVLR